MRQPAEQLPYRLVRKHMIFLGLLLWALLVGGIIKYAAPEAAWGAMFALVMAGVPLAMWTITAFLIDVIEIFKSRQRIVLKLGPIILLAGLAACVLLIPQLGFVFIDPLVLLLNKTSIGTLLAGLVTGGLGSLFIGYAFRTGPVPPPTRQWMFAIGFSCNVFAIVAFMPGMLGLVPSFFGRPLLIGFIAVNAVFASIYAALLIGEARRSASLQPIAILAYIGMFIPALVLIFTQYHAQPTALFTLGNGTGFFEQPLIFGAIALLVSIGVLIATYYHGSNSMAEKSQSAQSEPETRSTAQPAATSYQLLQTTTVQPADVVMLAKEEDNTAKTKVIHSDFYKPQAPITNNPTAALLIPAQPTLS